MAYLKSNLFFLIILMSWSSCSTTNLEDENESSGDELNFYFGSFGGLCGYSDSLSISSNLDTYFDQENFCTDEDFETSKLVSQEDYTDLVKSFSLSDFESMDINSCARCVDGIDNFLHIEGSEFKHRIVFSNGDNISLIQNLVTELESIREAHQPE